MNNRSIETMSEEVKNVENTESTTPETTAAEVVTTPSAEVSAENTQPATEETSEEAPRKVYTTKAEVIDRLKEIVQNDEDISRTEIDALKQVYYKMHASEMAAEREAFIAGGGTQDAYLPKPDETEEEFKAQMNLLRERRAMKLEEQEKEKKENLDRKLAIIEKVKEAASSPDAADKAYNEVKQLQAEWKEIKNIPPEKANEVWKTYQLYIEQFYDQLRLNHEFRAYDFKKNLESKTHLCEAAEKLAEVEDPVSAFHQLQKLHQEFREIGPVSKELREEIWARFKAASTIVNKRHQDHFEHLKAEEDENLVKKTALCEKVEAISTDDLKSFSDWEKKTEEIVAMQAEWKTIGFTPRKMNTLIFERFRAACDKFFHQKSDYFKSLRETLSANLAAKTAICEKAEALKDSTDWSSTGSKLVQLQKEWKEIGPVAHKLSDAIWKRFNGACNLFFEAKNAATAGQREEEEQNLATKEGIVTELTQLLENADETAKEKVRELMDKWNEVGHVPFRQKDKIYKKYRELVDRVYQEMHISAGRRHIENFKKTVSGKGDNELSRELDRLYRTFEAKKQEVQTYENNLSFFNAKSSKGNSLVEEVQKKVERLREDLNMISEKIKAVREQIKAAQQPTEEKQD